MPASITRWRDSLKASAVSATIFTPEAGPSMARIARVAARPSITGMCTSISTRSKDSDCTASSAWAPSSQRLT